MAFRGFRIPGGHAELQNNNIAACLDAGIVLGQCAETVTIIRAEGIIQVQRIRTDTIL